MRRRAQYLPHAEKHDNENIKNASMMSGITTGRGSFFGALLRNNKKNVSGRPSVRALKQLCSRSHNEWMRVAILGLRGRRAR